MARVLPGSLGEATAAKERRGGVETESHPAAEARTAAAALGPALERSFAALAACAGAVYLCMYLWICLARSSYPFELEWMEGGTVLHVQRILDGLALYAEPRLAFTAFIYTPLYYYVSAGLAALVGNGFLAPRLVSIAASIGCFALLYLSTRRQSGSRFFAYLGVCLFAATYRAAGAWLDVARVDSLFLALLLAGIYAYQTPVASVRSLVAPALFFCAFFTKQTALIAALPLCVASLVLRRGVERFLFPAILAALVAASTLLLDRWTGGWYRYYVFELPRDHGIGLSPDAVFGAFWIRDLLGHVPIALCFSLVPFLEGVGRRAWTAERVENACVFAGLLVAAWTLRLHGGAYDNVALPAYAGIAIFAARGMAGASSRLAQIGESRVGVLLAAVLQLVALFYRPTLQLPTPTDRAQANALLARIAAVPGEVYLADHPFYNAMLGRQTQAHTQALKDVLRGRSLRATAALRAEIDAAIREGRYEELICDTEGCQLPAPDLERVYVRSAERPTDVALVPVTGGADRKPTYLYRRRDSR